MTFLVCRGLSALATLDEVMSVETMFATPHDDLIRVD